jgi:hypothetical protein
MLIKPNLNTFVNLLFSWILFQKYVDLYVDYILNKSIEDQVS